MLEVLEADCDHHVASADGLAARHRRAKPTAFVIRAIESFEKERQGIDLPLLLKPVCVGQVTLERQRFDIGRRPPLDFEELLDGVDPQGVKLYIAGGAKVHAPGHVDFQKVHGLPNDQVIDAAIPGVNCHRQAIRPGPDDKQIGLFFHVLGASILRRVFLSWRAPTTCRRGRGEVLIPKPFSFVQRPAKHNQRFADQAPPVLDRFRELRTDTRTNPLGIK